MFWTRISIYTTVASTVYCGAWIDQSVPYFPTEISRTATGPVGQWVFLIGAVLSFAISIFEVKRSKNLLPFVGFLLLAAVPDTTSWVLHMLGIGLMVAGCMVHVHHIQDIVSFGWALGIYGTRVALKITAVAISYNTISIPFIFNTSMNIMHGKVDTMPILVRVVFSLCGVLQWVVLKILLDMCTQNE